MFKKAVEIIGKLPVMKMQNNVFLSQKNGKAFLCDDEGGEHFSFGSFGIEGMAKDDFQVMLNFNDLQRVAKALKQKTTLKVEIGNDSIIFNVDGAHFICKKENVDFPQEIYTPPFENLFENADEKVKFKLDFSLNCFLKKVSKMLPTTEPRVFLKCVHFKINKESKANVKITNGHFLIKKNFGGFSYCGENENAEFSVGKENMPALVDFLETKYKNTNGFADVNVLILKNRIFWNVGNDFIAFENVNITFPEIDEASFDFQKSLKVSLTDFKSFLKKVADAKNTDFVKIDGKNLTFFNEKETFSQVIPHNFYAEKDFENFFGVFNFKYLSQIIETMTNEAITMHFIKQERRSTVLKIVGGERELVYLMSVSGFECPESVENVENVEKAA